MTNSQWDVLPETPTFSSQKLGWEGILVERVCHTPSTGLNLPASGQHLVTLYLGSPLYLQQKRNGDMHEGKHVRGDITIVPAGCSSQWQWQGDPDVLRLRFDSQFLLSLVDPPEQSSTAIELTNQFVVRDRRIEQIGLMLLDELKSNNFGNRLCVESLRNLLAVHLLRCYSNIRKAEPNGSRCLSASQLRQVIEFINENLAKDLQLSDIAAVTNLSIFHFTRLFKQSIGVTPYQYLIQQRIAAAEQLLKLGKLSILEAAHQVGFSNQSHFHYHFKRLVGVTPKTILQHSKILQKERKFLEK